MGTRSRDGVLGRFGRTAFELACRADVPVVPIVIRCEPVYLGKGGGPLRMPYRVPRLTLTVLPAVSPRDHARDSRALKRAMEAFYLSELSHGGPRQRAAPSPRAASADSVR
jgi:1-acyl-sn-glycerol-3-phosphate acyltransferase